MNEPATAAPMTDRDRHLTEIIAGERPRLRNFIRRRVPNEADAEDLLQDVFYEVVEAYRLTEPVQRWSAWMFKVARNRIVDFFRKKRLEPSARAPAAIADDGEALLLEDVLASPEAGPADAYVQAVLLRELEDALDELPAAQREVFIAHEIEGASFKEIAAHTGVGVNTLLSRKHYAVLHLRRRLQAIYEEFVRTGG